MKKPLIIGVAGKKQAGKDTLFNELQILHEGCVSHYAFADALKAEYCYFNWINRENLVADKELHRRGLQEYGIKRRLIQSDYWIKSVDCQMKEAIHDSDINVITDVRFVNEAAYIRQVGGILVRVKRLTQGELIASDKHESETELDDYNGFDYILVNDGSLEKFQRVVAVFYNDHIKKLL